jgi:Glyoxalase/Bleomycin resistance protein/Dioxygenase superfamily
MDPLDQLLNDCRDAMSDGQTAVADMLKSALADHERLGAAIRSRPKPWFFAADETMTAFCTEGRPGNASAPHDHGTWSVLGCFDGSEESWWHEVSEESGLCQIGSAVLRTGEAHALPADVIHAVMNRWSAPNGIIHIYQGNFLAADRHGLSEPLAPTSAFDQSAAADVPSPAQARPALAGTAFAAISVNDLSAASDWIADTFGLRSLTTHDDSCAIDDQFNYLIEPGSLTIVGLHAAAKKQTRAGLEHVALRVPSLGELERWRSDLEDRGLNPSETTTWNFGTFVDVTGPEELTVRLFVPAVR